MAKRANTALVGVISLYVSLDGRIRRSEYWLGGLALNVIHLVVGFVLMGLVGFTSPSAKVVGMAMNVLFFWPSFALMVKRGHDRGRSAAFTTGFLVGIVALGAFFEPATVLYGDIVKWTCAVVMLLLGCFITIDYAFIDGEPGRNRFGPSPKNPDIGRPLSFDDDALPGGSASA